MNFKPKDTHAGLFILILHLVGLIGYLTPALRGYFLLLTPFNLILTCFVLVYLHRMNGVGSESTLLAVFLLGLLVEIVGVRTGVLFGAYSYGETLGVKVLEVPAVIGVNWLVLGYTFGAIAKKIPFNNKIVSILLAAGAMVLLDFLIEPVAIKYDYWSWEGGKVPLLNYIGWYVVSVIVQFLIQKLDLQDMYKISWFIVLAQLIFFLVLNYL